MNRILVSLTVLGTMLASGCAAPALPAKNKLPTLGGDWSIKFTHSGGFVGVSRWIEIKSDGSYLVVDDRSPDYRKTGQLTAQELEDLKKLVASTNYTPNELPSGCADCYVYTIEIKGEGKGFAVTVDEVVLPDTGLGPLVSDLRAKLEREMPK
jgi:hypothetical protein